MGCEFRLPEVGPSWDEPSRWSEDVRWKWKQAEHNNILEARAALSAASRIARSGASRCKALIISDSQVTVGAFSKGRSGTRVLNFLCRKLSAIRLGLGLRFVFRYVWTHRNHADAPSRGRPMGVLPEPSPQQFFQQAAG